MAIMLLSTNLTSTQAVSILNSQEITFLSITVSSYICFFFLGPLGFDSGRLMTPFRKWVSSNLPKKTNNPNPSPTGKIWFGLYWFGAGDRVRTGTLLPARDFKSLVSANSTTPAFVSSILASIHRRVKRNGPETSVRIFVRLFYRKAFTSWSPSCIID